MRLSRFSPVKTILFSSLLLFVYLTALPGMGWAGCKINLYVKNVGKAPVQILNSGPHSQVKIKMGTWKALQKGAWFSGDYFTLKPKKTKGDEYRATFNCGAKRRYKIGYMCLSGTNKYKDFTDYYPSPGGWTRKQTLTIPLRHCN